ncbi:MAG: TetR/AcrR family transcriptional regulator [Dehalococcoidia bacterium]
MPKLKPEELESRRREIIDAARGCFLRSGFHQTTTDEICRAASITPGGLYHYFASKEEIISAVIHQSSRDVAKRMSEMIDEPHDARSAFREAGMLFMQAIHGPDVDNVTRLDVEIFAEAVKNPRLAEISREAWGLRRDRLESLIRRGMDEGVYSAETVNPKGLASLLMAVIIGLRIGRLLMKDEFDLNGAVESLFQLQTGRLIVNIPEEELPKVAVPAPRT